MPERDDASCERGLLNEMQGTVVSLALVTGIDLSLLPAMTAIRAERCCLAYPGIPQDAASRNR